MKSTLLFALVFTLLAGCGVPAEERHDTHQNDLTDEPTKQLADTACVTAGGTCVAVTPGACATNHWGDPASCGEGIGVGCCLPAEPPPPPPSNACSAAGGTCVGISPGACASNHWGDPATCGDGIGVGCCLPAEPEACKPLPPPVGNPASSYCLAMGATWSVTQTPAGDEGHCTFSDGTDCEEWSFYRGACGQAHSFCNVHGGSVSSETRDQGTWVGTFAVCTLPGGTKCDEMTYARTCACE